jgi:ABC-2 type transport system ATP-binding protein
MMKFYISGLEKSYDNQTVLRGVDYKFEQGNIYGIIGRNGAGKTTLFNCINQDLDYSQGSFSIEIDGKTRPLSFDDVGIVSATPTLPEFLTGYEFIEFYKRFNCKDAMKTVEDYFKLVNIQTPDQHKLIKNYSYGMKNKLQLVCCLIRNPKVILLDEPLSSFDVIVSHDIKALLVQMKANHIILMSTHILQLATDISDKIILLKNGFLKNSVQQEMDSGEFEAYIINELSEDVS